MSKFTRLIAAGITSVVAVGVLAAPALAADPVETVEEIACGVLVPQRDEFIGKAAASAAALGALIDQVEPAQADLNASSTAMGVAGLAYIEALDGVGEVDDTLTAFNGAIATFADDLMGWIELADDVATTGMDLGVNQSLANYYTGLCALPVVS